jgi:hypothetical protein
VCQAYQSGKRTPVKGETACALPVGSFYPAGTARLASWGDRVTVTEQNDWFNITEGQGENQVSQSFNVISIEVLPDGCR